jgi:uncharacterized protein (TIGR03435 family)
MRAYDLKEFQISGPGWIDSDRYDVIATIPEGAPEEEVPVMLQNLLAERFQMRIHRSTKTYDGLVLGVGKGGSKLTPAAHPNASNNKDRADRATMSFDPPEQHLFGITMPALATSLSSEFGRPVVDSTQLVGKFDMSLPTALDGPEAESVEITGLRDLGLTLTPGKVQLDAIVVDKANETPDEN